MSEELDPQAQTLRAYDDGARRYIDYVGPGFPEEMMRWMAVFVTRLTTGVDILEIGSGPGRDAVFFESRGLQVERTDAVHAFVNHLIEQGHPARICNVLTGELGGPWAGVWANAVLLHLNEAQLRLALTRLLGATRPGGVLGMSVKQGDGEDFGNQRIGLERYFRYWREPALRQLLVEIGWQPLTIEIAENEHDTWLQVIAQRPTDNDATLHAYEVGVGRYIDALAPRASGPFTEFRDRFAADLATGAELLELGSGPGLDADWFEARGAAVRRTDATVAFVDRMRAQGHSADVLNVITDELGGPYDGIWASAVLLHLTRADLAAVLLRLRAALRPDGTFGFTVKAGDGERWTTDKLVDPRHFVYWQPAPLAELVAGAGWRVTELSQQPGRSDDWLMVRARP